MRVLLFSSSFAPRTGGLETVTRRLPRDLRERGHEVCVVTHRYPRTLPAYETIDGVPVHRQTYPRIIPDRERRTARQILAAWLLLPLAPLAFLRLAALVRRFRPDIVNVHYFSNPALYVMLLARLFRVPVVLSFHGSDLPTVPYPSGYRSVVVPSCRLATAFTTCSEHLHGHLARILSPQQVARSIVSRNGVSAEPGLMPRLWAEGPYVLLTARLTAKKGVDVAIRGVAILQRRGIPIRMLIAGDGPLRPDLERLAADLGVRSAVTFLGAMSPHDVRTLLRGASFAVVPSTWEAFGMVCLEAMIEGRAVVATRTGGVGEIVRDGQTGVLVEPRNPEALADAMATLLAHPDLARAMGDRGRDRALALFTWDRMTDAYLRVYRLALTPPSRASGASPSPERAIDTAPIRVAATQPTSRRVCAPGRAPAILNAEDPLDGAR